ncbi:WD40 repeat domain-containing protein [Candidatus Marithrix sp. Canyon 246]|uniref:WD40 repeat domain-containing protein n=1 Tax=Candidatus Marithrix sp. Canyon 246 TaxID=1827136 RepID=UPI00084A1109|nr:WD40 repeat domain-containing protein [Candidatus Marithrix sp. Canyon 246]
MTIKPLNPTRIRPDRFLKPVRSVLTLGLTLLILTSCNEVIKDPPKPKTTTTAPPILQIDPGGHKSKIKDVTFTSDGRYLVSAGGWMKNDEIRLYNFPTGKLVTLLKGHTNVVLGLAFSPNSRYLVSGSADKNAIIWDINQKQQLHTLKGHTNNIYAVAFTPDSKRVVITGSYDHSLRLWRVKNGKLIAKLQGHTNKVRSVAISPKNGTIASGSKDHTIRIWDGKTGQFIKTLANQGTVVGSLSFSPDGGYLVSGVGSGKMHCHV